MEKKKKYRHIFDYFDKDGKYAGGCEPVTESTEKPNVSRFGVYTNPQYVAYLGWCEDEKGKAYSGCCHPLSVSLDNDTKEIRPLYVTNVLEMDIYPYAKLINATELPKFKVTYESDCELRGVEPCQSYLDYKAKKEREFNEEYHDFISKVGSTVNV